uniref:Uncharacterized protein n=1 Tax=Cannabis sativa TaxID=3483 RepID=A0A803PAK1_CANSA
MVEETTASRCGGEDNDFKGSWRRRRIQGAVEETTTTTSIKMEIKFSIASITFGRKQPLKGIDIAAMVSPLQLRNMVPKLEVCVTLLTAASVLNFSLPEGGFSQGVSLVAQFEYEEFVAAAGGLTT